MKGLETALGSKDILRGFVSAAVESRSATKLRHPSPRAGFKFRR